MSDFKNLYEKLIEYSGTSAYPFHMPGHKRQMMFMENPYRFDLTEIDGFDNLHEAGGILREEQERAARLYGSEETHFVVNGSTGGILSAIGGVLQRGDRVLVARNCHTSVYHGLELNGLCPVYLWPKPDGQTGIYRGLTRGQVEEALGEYSDIRAVIFTSPTYEGLLSDVKGICEAAHQRGIPCIVDAAHGAHFLWAGLPDAVACGADVVVQSLHKTLPALTQTALLHINGGRVNRERIRRMLSVYQTSSPSYVLMASISQCMTWLEREGTGQFERYERQARELRKRLANMKQLYLYEPEADFDWGKLVIGTRDAAGRAVYDRLRENFGLQMEMASAGYVLAMTTVGDSTEGFERLADALEAIDLDLQRAEAAAERRNMITPRAVRESAIAPERHAVPEVPSMPVRCMEIDRAVIQPMEEVPLDKADGRVMGDYLYLYPPGIPMLVPGEVIQMKHIERIKDYLSQGLEVHGGYSKESGNVKVILHHG